MICKTRRGASSGQLPQQLINQYNKGMIPRLMTLTNDFLSFLVCDSVPSLPLFRWDEATETPWICAITASTCKVPYMQSDCKLVQFSGSYSASSSSSTPLPPPPPISYSCSRFPKLQATALRIRPPAANINSLTFQYACCCSLLLCFA